MKRFTLDTEATDYKEDQEALIRTLLAQRQRLTGALEKLRTDMDGHFYDEHSRTDVTMIRDRDWHEMVDLIEDTLESVEGPPLTVGGKNGSP